MIDSVSAGIEMISDSAPYPSKTVRRSVLAVFITFWFFILLAVTTANAKAETYQVLRVYDGDTITILNEGQKQSIRLVGIDTPEKSRKKNEPNQPYSQKATKFLGGMVLGKQVSIESFGTDHYKRVLGVVLLDQTNVNLEMVRNGYAEVYRGRPAKGFDNDPYWQAEAQAKDEKLNI